MADPKKPNARLVAFAMFYGVYFTFLFVYYFATRNSIPAEYEVVMAYQGFYNVLFYTGFLLLPLFVMIPLYTVSKKQVSRLACFLLLSTPVFAGWFIARLVVLLMVERPAWEQ